MQMEATDPSLLQQRSQLDAAATATSATAGTAALSSPPTAAQHRASLPGINSSSSSSNTAAAAALPLSLQIAETLAALDDSSASEISDEDGDGARSKIISSGSAVGDVDFLSPASSSARSGGRQQQGFSSAAAGYGQLSSSGENASASAGAGAGAGAGAALDSSSHHERGSGGVGFEVIGREPVPAQQLSSQVRQCARNAVCRVH